MRSMKKIEKYIAPIVDALNNFSSIKTHSSCHGHWGRPNAWVVFSCRNVKVIHTMWLKLQRSSDKGFCYRWSVNPWFTFYDGDLGFKLEGTPIGIRFKLPRKKILQDTEKLKELIFVKSNIDEESHKDKSTNKNMPVSMQPTSTRIFCIAFGTSLSIGSNLYSTCVTYDELCHEVVYHIVSGDSKKRRIKQKILISCPVEHISYLYKLAEMLRNLCLEGAYKTWPEIKGYFLTNRALLLISLG